VQVATTVRAAATERLATCTSLPASGLSLLLPFG